MATPARTPQPSEQAAERVAGPKGATVRPAMASASGNGKSTHSADASLQDAAARNRSWQPPGGVPEHVTSAPPARAHGLLRRPAELTLTTPTDADIDPLMLRPTRQMSQDAQRNMLCRVNTQSVDMHEFEADITQFARANANEAIMLDTSLTWDFGIVCNSGRCGSSTRFEELVKALSLSIMGQGLELALVEKDPSVPHMTVLLVCCPEERIRSAWAKEQRYRWVQSGVGVDLGDKEDFGMDDTCDTPGVGSPRTPPPSLPQSESVTKRRMTRADRIAAVSRILTNEVFHGFDTEALCAEGPGPTAVFVDAVFPLRSPDWIAGFVLGPGIWGARISFPGPGKASYPITAFCSGTPTPPRRVGTARARVCVFWRLRHVFPDLGVLVRPGFVREYAQRDSFFWALLKNLWRLRCSPRRVSHKLLRRDQWFIEQLRYQYGTQTAVYFWLTSFVTTALFPCALFFVLWWGAARFAAPQVYTAGLAVFGWLTASVMAPLAICTFERRISTLLQDWGPPIGPLSLTCRRRRRNACQGTRR